MKKIISVLGLSMIIFLSQAQDSVTVKMGFLFNPQGSFSIKSPEKGSKLVMPLLLVTVINKGKNTFIPNISLSGNAVGMIYSLALSKEIEIYVLGNKFFLDKGGYASVGVTRTLGIGNGFIEVGTVWNKWSPDINIGFILPMTFKVKRK